MCGFLSLSSSLIRSSWDLELSVLPCAERETPIQMVIFFVITNVSYKRVIPTVFKNNELKIIFKPERHIWGVLFCHPSGKLGSRSHGSHIKVCSAYCATLHFTAVCMFVSLCVSRCDMLQELCVSCPWLYL